MRQEVRNMAQGIASELLEGLDFMTIFEIQEEYELELTEEEAKWILSAVSGARTTLDPKVAGKIKRLQYAVTKLAGGAGVDISELIEDSFLQEEDMD
ncbi:hypothetical protein AUR04nite_00100 [Glutamicibacter uratoxydans]|uniref:Uncharacterized protein n=1 Tax=Glutamicibacter uratoxydans TaxID=43667 RepID=A0A4Y4DMA8_GLUUR|nr:hypothetical protein [Glutamicibacter uratoxydans]GED04478.1 hypothetical protein AUR04nite_00100 [Glutamicibacter uratoxydans]